MTGHSVVPIGGAPFIRPYSTVRALESGMLGGVEGYASHHSHMLSSPTSSSSPQSQHAPLSPSQGSPTSISSPSTSFSSSASESSSSNHHNNNIQLEAALRYSSALHDHTRKMWEKERMTIEKQKFESSPTHLGYAADDNQVRTLSPASMANNTPSRRSSLGNSLGVEGIFGRKKRHNKNKSLC